MAGVCKLKSDIKPERGLTLKLNEQWALRDRNLSSFSLVTSGREDYPILEQSGLEAWTTML